jgi:hypothetical protein
MDLGRARALLDVGMYVCLPNAGCTSLTWVHTACNRNSCSFPILSVSPR